MIQVAGPPVIALEGVTKRFKDIYALRNVSLTIRQGSVFGLLGPNGAGKSTLLRLVLGFLHPDEGTIRVFGSRDLTRAHAFMGYLPERPRFHGNFSGREYVQLHARLSGMSPHDARTAARQTLEAVGIASAADRPIRTYSKGMRQRLGLAVAVTNGTDAPPPLLILDEPASGLDPEGQAAVRDFILDCRQRGSTVLLCSHQLTEVERICTTVGILRSGKLVSQTSLNASPRTSVVAVPRDGAAAILPHLVDYLRKLHPAVTISGGQSPDEPLHVSLPTGSTVPNATAMKAAALRAIIDARWDITSIHIDERDVESLYFEAAQPTGRNQPEQQATSPSVTRITSPLSSGEESSAGTGEPVTEQSTQTPGGASTAPLPPLPPDQALQNDVEPEQNAYDGNEPFIAQAAQDEKR